VKWYKFAAAEYQIKTIHLSDAEDLTYRRLLDMAYLSEKPIPLDTNLVARRVRIDQDIVEQVLSEFFELTDEGYRNRRVEEEIKSYQVVIDRNLANSAKASEAAARRASQGIKRRSPRTQNEPTGNPVDSQSDPSGNQNKNKNISPLTPLAGGFDRFWEIWPKSPRKVGKGACMSIWLKNGIEEHVDRIVSHVSRLKSSTQWLSGYEPSPQTYLNQRRWLDDETPALPYGRKVL
jgi:uncharacterized protein YdaU (DUF1376 family)